MKLKLSSALLLLCSFSALSQENIQYLKDPSENLKMYKVWDFSLNPDDQNKNVMYYDGKEIGLEKNSFFNSSENINSKLEASKVDCFTGKNSIICLGYNNNKISKSITYSTIDSKTTVDTDLLKDHSAQLGYKIFSEKNLTADSIIELSEAFKERMANISIGESISEVLFFNDIQATQETVLVHATRFSPTAFLLSYSKPDNNDDVKYNKQYFYLKLPECAELYKNLSIEGANQAVGRSIENSEGSPSEQRTITIKEVSDKILNIELLKEDDATFSSKSYMTPYCTR
jgi:hypothetical protein